MIESGPSNSDSVRRLSYWTADSLVRSKIPYQENWLALCACILNPKLEVDEALFAFGLRPYNRDAMIRKIKETAAKTPRPYNPIAIVESLLAGKTQPEIAAEQGLSKQIVSKLKVMHIKNKEPFRPIDIETYGKPGDWYYAIHSDKT